MIWSIYDIYQSHIIMYFQLRIKQCEFYIWTFSKNKCGCDRISLTHICFVNYIKYLGRLMTSNLAQYHIKVIMSNYIYIL